MPRPAKYILNTDYATLSNDSGTETIIIPIPGTIISLGETQVLEGSTNIGTIGSPMEYDINYSMTSHRWKTSRLQFVENDSTTSQYQGNIFVYRSSATAITVRVVLFYGGPSASITKTARTVTVRVRTYIPPFA